MTQTKRRPVLLDLYCKAGGCATGYHRAGFDVVGVDIQPQPRYPYKFIQSDALVFLRSTRQRFDVYHASPPCQADSELTPVAYKHLHSQLISPTRELLLATGKPYVIENVEGARRRLINPVMLCGSMFGLDVWRHRLFECRGLDFTLWPQCDHSRQPVVVSGRCRNRPEPNKAERSAAMGIDWMTCAELDEAVPPAYTEFLGRHLRQSILEAIQ